MRILKETVPLFCTGGNEYGFSVALQVYSVRDYAERDLKKYFTEDQKMGYDGVEFAGLYGHTASEVKQMVEEIGLIPISLMYHWMKCLRS